MKTFWILLVDSVRMLRAQKMFWIVLGLSSLVALVYASVGISEDGWSVFFGLIRWDDEVLGASEALGQAIILQVFTDIIVRFWLSLIAVALALISCAAIFPEFVQKGSVDVVVSKPPRRIVLFIGKYVGSLLFVFVQVAVFCVIVFLNFGIRFGDWNFTIFWAVPIVVFTFSLIYSVHVLVSIWSNSVIFGLLAAFLVWGISVLADWGELVTYTIVYLGPQQGMETDFATGQQVQGDPRESTGNTGETVYGVVNGLRTLTPKTRVAADQMNRLIKVDGESIGGVTLEAQAEGRELTALERFQTRHPIWKDVLSSALFEGIFVGLAALVFCRRDY